MMGCWLQTRGSLLALRGGGGALVEVSLVGREVYVSATGELA